MKEKAHVKLIPGKYRVFALRRFQKIGAVGEARMRILYPQRNYLFREGALCIYTKV